MGSLLVPAGELGVHSSTLYRYRVEFGGISVECGDKHNVPSREEYHTLKIGCVSDINPPLSEAVSVTERKRRHSRLGQVLAPVARGRSRRRRSR